MKKAQLASATLFVAFLFSCAGSEEVTRRRGEWTQKGRRVSPLAYAWYARGGHHERRGDLSSAARDYRAALDHDPKSGSAWAALGRVLCQMQDAETQRTFDRGLKAAERRAPLYAERGACRLARKESSKRSILSACGDFAQAVRLEPRVPRFSTEYSDCLRIAGRLRDAERVERAARLFFGTKMTSSQEPTLAEVDRALLSGDLEQAQNLSLELMSPGALAVRAVLLGQNRLARDQAELVLLASPGDVHATTALLALGAQLPSSTNTLRGLSAPGLVLLFKVLKREANTQVANQFLEQYRNDLLNAEDPLVTEALDESTSSP